jgi:hypothetical protein
MRHYFSVLTIGGLFLVALFLAINLLVDPYRIFHKPWIRDNYYIDDHQMRIEASGIINTVDFDAIVLGTSMARNFSPKEASIIFGKDFVNISLNGSTLAERSLVLDYAFQKKRLTTVISSLDLFTFDSFSIVASPMVPYTYLYDKTPLNDFKVYLSNPKIFQYALCKNILISSDKLCPGTRTLENLTEWYSDQEETKKFGGLDNWLNNKHNYMVRDAISELSKSIDVIHSGQIKAINRAEVHHKITMSKKVFNVYLLSHIAKHPEVEFYLFFPPYSRLNYAITRQSAPQDFEIYLETIKFVVRDSKQYNNVKIFGFEPNQFPDDIANYKDTKHYHPRFNSKMLAWMKSGDYQITTTNLDAYIKTISELAQKYDLNKIKSTIDAHLKAIN